MEYSGGKVTDKMVKRKDFALTIEILRDFYGLKDFVQSSEGHK